LGGGFFGGGSFSPSPIRGSLGLSEGALWRVFFGFRLVLLFAPVADESLFADAFWFLAVESAVPCPRAEEVTAIPRIAIADSSLTGTSRIRHPPERYETKFSVKIVPIADGARPIRQLTNYDPLQMAN
jgi:hypothetical protein